MLGNSHALATFHLERFGHHGHCENAKFLGNLRNDWCRACTGATAHTGRNEQHIGTFDHFLYAVAIFHRCLATNVGISSRTEPFRYVAADLQRCSRACSLQRLRVRIRTYEIDTVYPGFDHMSDRVATATTDTDDFDNSALTVRIH